MKKIAVFVVLMCMLTSALVANEVSFFYPTLEHQRYWHFTDNGTRFDWYGKNYSVDLNLTPLLIQNPLEVNEAWIKFGGKAFGVKVGMMWYPFGNVETLPSKNISIHQPMNFDSAVLLDFYGMFGDIGWQAYYADAGRIIWSQPWDKPSFMGVRFTYGMEDLKIGVSVRAKNLISNKTEYSDVGKIAEFGADVCWLLAKSIKLNVQGYSIQKDLTTDATQMDIFGLISYEKGFDLPIVKLTRPYAGYFSKSGMEDYNIIVGLNMKPMENVFMKLEYNFDSLKNGDVEFDYPMGNAISLQAGYVF